MSGRGQGGEKERSGEEGEKKERDRGQRVI